MTALRGGRGGGGAAAHLRAEVRALDAQLDAGGTLELGILAAALRLALPSGLGARHACVCWRGGVAGKQPAKGGKRRMCEAAAGRPVLRRVVRDWRGVRASRGSCTDVVVGNIVMWLGLYYSHI